MVKMNLIGRLGQDAQVNNVNGKSVINFSVADSEKYKNQQGGDVEKVNWYSCSYWTDKLNLANYLKKGTLVYLEGKPESKIYTNSKNESIPQQHCRVSFVQLLSSKQDENNA